MKVIILELGSELKMGLSKVLRLKSFVLVYHLSKIDTFFNHSSERVRGIWNIDIQGGIS